MTILYKLLRQERKRANLTQTEVARIIGVNPSTVNRWESGENKPTIISCVKLAELYGTSIEYFYGVSKSANIEDLELDSMQREMLEGMLNFTEKQLDLLFEVFAFLEKRTSHRFQRLEIIC